MRLLSGDHQQVLYRARRLTKPVNQLIEHLITLCGRLHTRDPLINIEFLVLIGNIRRRNVGIHLYIQCRLKLCLRRQLALLCLDRLV